MKCDALGGDCVAIGFKTNSQCITYQGHCTDSNDGVNWGIDFYRKRPVTTTRPMSTIMAGSDVIIGGTTKELQWLHSTTSALAEIVDNETNVTGFTGTSETGRSQGVCGQMCNVSAWQEQIASSSFRTVDYVKKQAKKAQKEGVAPYWMLAAGCVVVVVCSVGKTCANRGICPNSKESYSNLAQGPLLDVNEPEPECSHPGSGSPLAGIRQGSRTEEELFENALQAALNVEDNGSRQSSKAP